MTKSLYNLSGVAQIKILLAKLTTARCAKRQSQTLLKQTSLNNCIQFLGAPKEFCSSNLYIMGCCKRDICKPSMRVEGYYLRLDMINVSKERKEVYSKIKMYKLWKKLF